MSDLFTNPFSQMGNVYILRSTGEEVEVISSNIGEDGSRSDSDWVTYIDSKGTEHIKEHLNLKLDFKVKDTSFSALYDMLKGTSMYHSMDNGRVYDITKELVVTRGYNVEKGIAVAKEIVEKVNEAIK